MAGDPPASREDPFLNGMTNIPPEDSEDGDADDAANLSFPGDAIDSLHGHSFPNGDDCPFDPPAASESEEEETEEETWETRRQNTPLDVDVAWHNFEHFKNRYSPKDGMAIIEVLRGHQHIAQEIAKEMGQRNRSRGGFKRVRVPGPTKSTMDADDCWIQRIRIQSPELICLLSRLTGHRDGWATDRPRVFFQPFRMFHYFLPQMRECLKILEEKWAAVVEGGHQPLLPTAVPKTEVETKRRDTRAQNVSDDGSDVSDDSDSSSDDGFADNVGPMDPILAVSGDLVDSPVTLSHVRTYVKFVEDHILPNWDLAASSTKRKVRFNDLWMYFKEGELLYMPPASDSDDNSAIGKQHATTKKMYQNAWRLYSMVLSSVKDDTPDDTVRVSKRCLDLHSYYLDYDGTSYVPVRHMFCIKDYEDEKDMTSFEIYPMRFVKNSESIMANLHKEGGWFRDAMNLKHLFYDGWTLPYGPTADAPSSDAKDAPQNPAAAPIEHVDGDVMIDFVEGFKSEPALGPGPSTWSQGLRDFNDSDWPVGDDDVPINHWEPAAINGAHVTRYVGEIKEKSQRGEWFCEKMRNDHMNKRKSLQAHKAGKLVTALEDDELALLPRRVVAYTFRERKFAMLDIRSMKPLPPSESVFKDLKIDEQHKRMVKSLVKSHLKKQVAQKKRPTINLNQDLIRGKGSGLFILLHGVPGVGKTATAEAVAQANKKPLFSITCGDLGFSPKEVENALKDIFRLAHHWDCVLLLDEADIFLSRRELGDLKRNALVSVFLRVLEYYSGILFLTTNRVGTLDEAFKSRIHVSLYYPPLTKERTLAVFEVNIRKLREIEAEHESVAAENVEEAEDCPKRLPLEINEASILDYAEWHFDAHKDSPEQRWNGRQIRNAFQIAYSLAHFDMHKTSLDQWEEDEDNDDHPNTAVEKGPAPTSLSLDYRQFEMVADAIEKFEEYLYRATGATDKDKAATKHTRADDFDPYRWEPKHVYRTQPPRSYHRSTYVPPERRGPPPQGPPPRQRSQYQPQRREGPPPQPRSAQQQQPQRRLLEVPGTPLRNNSPQPRDTNPLRSGPPLQGKPRYHASTFPTSSKSSPAAGPSRRSDSGYSGSGWSPRTPRTEIERDEEEGQFLAEEAIDGGEYADYGEGELEGHYDEVEEDEYFGHPADDRRRYNGASGEYTTL